MVKPMATALLVAAIFLGMPRVGFTDTEEPPDYDIPNGHFYTQTNGAPLGTSALGYSITDDYGVPFWSEFQRLGGVERLGYPTSQRFVFNGLLTQTTQKAVLQWSPATGQVQLINVLDYLHDNGKEDWLQHKFMVPAASGSVTAPDPGSVMRWMGELGRDALPLRLHYVTAADPWKLFGVPIAPPRDLGDLIAVRFQRTVLQLWKVSGPGIAPGEVTTLNAGDVLKMSGALPRAVLEPQKAPPAEMRTESRQERASSRAAGSPLRGVATWYGWSFKGQRMANGEIYDPENPEITAANAFPFGSWLRVVNLANAAYVDVRVTDRGAFRYPIVVDLSWAAFRRLADPNQGVINVLVQPIHRE